MTDQRLADFDRRLEEACRRRGFTRAHLRGRILRERLQSAARDAAIAVQGLAAAARQGSAAVEALAAQANALREAFRRGDLS